MGKTFMDDDFLLSCPQAVELYHTYAKHQAIIDYHNHLSPQAIADNINFQNITGIWLKEDHYKWRAMRANGIKEEFITGTASPKVKFVKWAETVPYTIRNPLYHWTHLELQRYFGITDLLRPESADDIYHNTSEVLSHDDFSTQSLLKRMKVEVVCTTDDPADSLEHHRKHAKCDSDLIMLPTFRPDKYLNIDSINFLENVGKLENSVGYEIRKFDDLLSALEARVDYFDSLGCRLADHGLEQLYPTRPLKSIDRLIEKRKLNHPIEAIDGQLFQTKLLHHLAEMYNRKGWVMQLHLGALRNNNSYLLDQVGTDAGCDSIGDFEQGRGLSNFLNGLASKDILPKAILYNLNPRDNELFATMAGNFSKNGYVNHVQWGAAWWFLDQKDGIEKQLTTLSNMGLLSRFVGMLTDSRSFLSFPRHEYFRRILCNLIGRDMMAGELPNDMAWIGNIVSNICYKNAKEYFNFKSVRS